MSDREPHLEGTHVLAKGEDVPSIVAEHSAGTTMLNAMMTFNPDTGDTRPIVVFGDLVTAAGDDAQISILIHMARDLLLMAADRADGNLEVFTRATEAAREAERAGLAQYTSLDTTPKQQRQ